MKNFYELDKMPTVEWIGSVENPDSSIKSQVKDQVMLKFGGIESDSHFGLTRPSCVRVEDLYPVITPIRNVRQLSIVAIEELELIAKDMGINDVGPELLGANIAIKGIDNFSLITPSTRLQFASGATVTIDLINHPCNFPAQEIEKLFQGKGKLFKAAARNRRGVTAWVEREGSVSVGDSVKVFIPMQDSWSSHSSGQSYSEFN
ncbi:MAG: MOSC domain-containing protein [Rhodobacteraceae bacterium]|nr:MOSC domain-containing protein [Paracoccaceae bacterium]